MNQEPTSDPQPLSDSASALETSPTLNLVQSIASNWWVLFIRGLLLIILGLYALLNPGLSLLVWALVVGCYLIADGVLAVIAGVAGWVESRGWMIARGVVAILVGGFAVAHPALFGTLAGITVIAFAGVGSIISGVAEMMVAIRERKAIQGEGWMILSGSFSILFGIVLLVAPLLSLGVFIRLSGAVAILFGCVAIFASFKLKQLRVK